jgi:ADP-ribosylglycohydrolase
MLENNNKSRRKLPFFAGCFLGGAVGDALGASMLFARIMGESFGEEGIPDYVPTKEGKRLGEITAHTQMTLFTADGLIRARKRALSGDSGNEVLDIYYAYLRWMDTQDESSVPLDSDTKDVWDGWLITLPELHAIRSPSKITIPTLRTGKKGEIGTPITNNKGSSAVVRTAPVGLTKSMLSHDPFTLGGMVNALTHGHPTGVHAAGFFAETISNIVAGATLEQAISSAITILRNQPNHEECIDAVETAVKRAHNEQATAENVESFGLGWDADDALAISLFCALKAESFEHGVTLAVNHRGDREATGAMTGSLLGILMGKEAIPSRWLEPLELRAEIEELTRDFASYFIDDWEKYPIR